MTWIKTDEWSPVPGTDHIKYERQWGEPRVYPRIERLRNKLYGLFGRFECYLGHHYPTILFKEEENNSYIVCERCNKTLAPFLQNVRK